MNKIIQSILLSCLLATNVHALHINAIPGSDITGMPDGKFSVSYKLYFDGGWASKILQVEGLPVSYFQDFFNGFNSQYSDKNPVSSPSGELSTISLGYAENGVLVYPVSCKNIILSGRDNTQIYFTKDSCVVE